MEEGDLKENKKKEDTTLLGEMQQVGESVGEAFIEIGKLVFPQADKERENKKRENKKEMQAELKPDIKSEIKGETKEVQDTILAPKSTKVPKEEFYSVIKLIAPGTNFRTALDGVLRAGKGALIVIENDKLLHIIDGGFRVNCRFTPQRLIELSKMDGAIILSRDMKKINYANVLLTPDSKIKTSETGTRHKAAERTAKQVEGTVIAISERKHEISMFYKTLRHTIKNTDELFRRANSHIQLLEKQRELFDSYVDKLTRLEIRNYINLHQAISVIQKGKIIQKIAEDLKKHLVELGNEGILLKTRLKEITSNIEKETDLVIKDYSKIGIKKSKILIEDLSYDEILDTDNIIKALSYEKPIKLAPIKGWRILSRTGLQEAEIAAIIKELGSLGRAIHSNARVFAEIVGDEKASIVKEEIERIKLNY